MLVKGLVIEYVVYACAKLEDARRELEQLLPSLPAQEKSGSLLATLVRQLSTCT